MEDSAKTSSDVPNGVFASPGFRVLYTLFTCLSIGFTLSVGTGMFVGMLVLSVGLATDYLKFKPVSKGRRWSRKWGLRLSLAWMICCLLALWGGATVVYDHQLPQDSDNFLAIPGGASVDKYMGVSHLYVLINQTAPFGAGYSFSARFFWAITAGFCVFWTLLDRFTENRELEKHLIPSEASHVELAATNQK